MVILYTAVCVSIVSWLIVMSYILVESCEV